MNLKNPYVWALIGFGIGAVIAASGSIATPADSILGGLIQALIWYGVSSFIIKSKSKKTEFIQVLETNVSLDNHKSIDGLVQAKICDGCGERTPIDYLKCFKCDGTSFTHKKVAAGEYVSVESPNLLPEFKTCPMCAEEIKFAAKKCRYCNSLIE